MACNTHLILAMLLISSFVVAPAMAGRGTGELVYHVHQSKYLQLFILQDAKVIFCNSKWRMIYQYVLVSSGLWEAILKLVNRKKNI